MNVTLNTSDGPTVRRALIHNRGLALVDISGLSIFNKGPFGIIHAGLGQLVLDNIHDEIVGIFILRQAAQFKALTHPADFSPEEVRRAQNQLRVRVAKIMRERGYNTVGKAWKVQAEVRAAIAVRRNKRHAKDNAPMPDPEV